METRTVEDKQTTEQTVTTSTEILDGCKQCHTLQTRIDSLLVSVSAQCLRVYGVQKDLGGEPDRDGNPVPTQFQRLNGMVMTIESELSTVREAAMQQAQDYQALLNLKVKLEREIATYKQLLEGADMGAIMGGAIMGGGGMSLSSSYSAAHASSGGAAAMAQASASTAASSSMMMQSSSSSSEMSSSSAGGSAMMAGGSMMQSGGMTQSTGSMSSNSSASSMSGSQGRMGF
ncbi:hypothetical protein AAFF_G00199890 [Aldrovandia affinis]|uniref:IF rod domain-containing protein n=1 Tax=Aldrovandia affinis TaxID=143900 RepID=A0AAD7W5M9_9TELE|nr:hypothetical protein AAFF_G00199890 [Aldrovandia affinis]